MSNARGLSLSDLMADFQPADRARREYEALREENARLTEQVERTKNLPCCGDVWEDSEKVREENTALRQRAEAAERERDKAREEGRQAGLREAADIAQEHVCSKAYGLCCCQGDIERDIRALLIAPRRPAARGRDAAMTKRQLEILQHALGVDAYGQGESYRNHFCAGGADEDDCRELVRLGYMQQHPTTAWLPYFNCSVTEAGKLAMYEASPKPPKLTPGQRRYRQFLAADPGCSFGEWLKARTA